MADPIPKYPLYDATYTAYRLSPLYHGSNILLDEMTLRMHARRMRDILRGDILRGVDVGAAGSTDGNISGTLESCKWDLFGDEEAWEQLHRPDAAAPAEQEEPGDLTDAPALNPASARGVHIELRYQKAHHTALLLRDPSETPNLPTGFTSLPLLLVRMPAALRDTLTTYLTQTFDTRLAPLHLPSTFLATTLERLLANADDDDNDSSPLPSRLHLQLSFPTTPSLRSLDISLPRSDLPAFLHRGGAAAAAPPVTEKTSLVTGPLTSALARYLDAHLALDLAHPAVRLAKIALPPLLALSADGRVKLFSPDGGVVGRGVVDGVYGALVGAARGAVDAAAAVIVVGKGKKSGKGVGGGEEVVVEAKKAKAKAKGVAKGKKRALGVGDANAGRKGAGGKKRRVRRDESGEEGEEEEDAEEGDEDDGEEDGVAGAAGAGAGAGGRGRLSLPKEPPPPYELHDPARVAGGR